MDIHVVYLGHIYHPRALIDFRLSHSVRLHLMVDFEEYEIDWPSGKLWFVWLRNADGYLLEIKHSNEQLPLPRAKPSRNAGLPTVMVEYQRVAKYWTCTTYRFYGDQQLHQHNLTCFIGRGATQFVTHSQSFLVEGVRHLRACLPEILQA